MRFDGREIGHGWLAVAVACGTNKSDAIVYKTVAIEEYDGRGVLLSTTDRRMLLKVWVPDLDFAAPPSIDEAPDRVVVVRDADGRGRGLLGYVCSLVAREGDDYIPGTVQVRIDFDQRLPAGSDPAMLEGMEPTYVVLTVPDVEKVYLEVASGDFPDWRPAADGFVSDLTAEHVSDPELLERLAKVGKHAHGPVRIQFAGEGETARIDYPKSDPHVSGFLAPVNYLVDDASTDDDVDPPEAPELTDEEIDDTLIAAAELVVEHQFPSRSMLQRKLRISYARAVGVMYALEALAVIGPEKPDGQMRDVLIPAEGADLIGASIREQFARQDSETATDSDSDPPDTT
ncbi:DNA translocase FtsK [Nocardioides sp. R-C-SC26]|uniref:DNA translocase FtsK n=1 Tax=Nocardioides sp. R-C-SC26 TaxID=2870414 RepID=UPI001E5F6A28|nr:DNA translocase FtsK [Nocardioides sp. R-C-SC26]